MTPVKNQIRYQAWKQAWVQVRNKAQITVYDPVLGQVENQIEDKVQIPVFDRIWDLGQDQMKSKMQ